MLASGTSASEPVPLGAAVRAPSQQLAPNPAWSTLAPLSVARGVHTATLLPSGKVLVAGGDGSSGRLASAELYEPATGSWSSTGSLAQARQDHTATLLPSGKVLVVGGTGPTGPFSSAELYDPASGSWSSTGSLAQNRYGHTATLLPSGKVLVVGGMGSTGLLDSAELYDPASGSWSSTGSLVQDHLGHTATLLPSGKVLVVGGDTSSGNLFTAELYDPATGTWSSTGPIARARKDHTATLLPSGKVLVVGGMGPASGPLVNAELYDPASGSWSSTGSLSQGRAVHTATLLPSGKVLVTGGDTSSSRLAGVETYDPASGTWAPAPSLTQARGRHTATLMPSGKVLVLGGLGASSYLSSVELYDPNVSSWVNGTSLLVGRWAHTATLLPSGKVLVTGGAGSGYPAIAELYDPATGTWSTTGSMAQGRYTHSATLLRSGKVLVVGGEGNGGYLASAELYDPATGFWSSAGSLSQARALHTATLLPSGRVLVAGGQTTSNRFASAELYDSDTNSWIPTGSMPLARSSHTAALLPSGKVLVAGGYTGSAATPSAALYDPTAGTWTATGSLAQARYHHAGVLLPSGKVLVVGGTGTVSYMASAELYDPATGTWSTTGSLAQGRFGHTATLLLSGKVLVSSGGSSILPTEAYDPATGVWTEAGPTHEARYYHTATLLPSGQVIITGGYNGLSSTEVYEDSGANPAWRPVISSVSPGTSLELGSTFTVNGSLLRGLSEASGGNGRSSPTDFPLLTLLELETGRRVTPALRDFSRTHVTASVPLASPGVYLLVLTVNGLSSGQVVHLAADLTAPETTLTLTPPSPTNATTATFTFSSNETGSSFECKLDGASLFTPCTSPATYSGLAEGTHTFQVRARDAAGNVDASPASHTWQVDTTPPDTVLTLVPADPINATTATFTFSSTEAGSRFECRLDGSAFTPCAPPFSTALLAEGIHFFQVRARDAAGNVDPSPASHTWKVDTTPPDTVLTLVPADPINTATATFTFSSNETGSSFECRLDGSAFTPCAPPFSTALLAEGIHFFQVRARDAAGNVDPSPASHTWKVDTTPPLTTLTSSSTHDTAITFTFSSNEAGASFECSLDGIDFLSCTSPATYWLAIEGPHSFQVRARDAAGNVDASPASYTWQVDLTAPETTLTSSSSDGASITFGFISNEAGASFECSLDGAAFSSCISPKNYASLADGPHSFQVRARDAAGNADASPASYSWEVDQTAPETILSSAPASSTQQATATFGFSSNEAGVSFECSLDGAAFSACTSPTTYTSLIEGAHTFQVRARDAAGKVDASPASYTWRVDLTAPAAPVVTSPTNGATLEDNTPVVSGTAQPGSTVTLTLDGSVAGTTTADAAGAWSIAVASALADGQHTVTATASDTGGTSPASAAVSFTIDTSPDTPDDPTPPTEGCGCGAGSGDASWLLTGLALLAGIASRRRRVLG